MNRVGIPRSLFYYYYGNFWQDFFDSLNIPYVISPISNQDIINRGVEASNDEMCLSLKNYLGHVDYLKDKCDYILVPRISNFKNSNQTCTNFWAAYDIVKNKFQTKLLHYNIDLDKGKTLKKGLYKIGKELGKTKHQIKKAYKYALIKEKRHHGYMTSVLIGLSNIIFKDEENNVEKIILKIDSLNKKSQKTASLANFEKVKRKYGRYTYVLTKDSQNKRAQQ